PLARGRGERLARHHLGAPGERPHRPGPARHHHPQAPRGRAPRRHRHAHRHLAGGSRQRAVQLRHRARSQARRHDAPREARHPRPRARAGAGLRGAGRPRAPPGGPAMSARALAAVGLALLLALPLVPLAAADPPVAESWSPYDTLSTTTALAFARQRVTIAAALGPAPINSAGPSCPTPSVSCVPGTTQTKTDVPDLSILQSDRGWAHNGTGNVAVNGQSSPEGRSLVAVSADGHAVASVGIDRTTHTPLPGAPSPTGPTPTLPGGVPQTLKLYVDEVPVGANFSAGPVSAMTV